MGAVTDVHADVTCRLCLARFPALAPHEVAPEAYGVEAAAVVGTREVPAVGLRAVERSIAGDDDCGPRARFRGWAQLHEHCARVRDDGSPVRSTSDPGRFGARAQTSGSAVRLPSGRDDVIEVERVLARATAHGARDPRGGTRDRLSSSMTLAVYLLRCEGRPLVERIAADRKGLVVRRVELSADQVAERLGDGWTAHHVGLLVRAVRAVAGPMLEAKGILPARATREESESMRIDGYDLEGWKEIADALGVSEATARRYQDAGLPVAVVGGSGRIVANRSAVCAWNCARVQPKAS